MSGKIIVFANQKGGVGKTTTAVNVGAYIAEEGKKVLLIDFDPQGNMSSSVGSDKEKPGIYEVITDKISMKEAIQETTVRNLNIVSSNVNLAGANVELIDADRREFFLKNAVLSVIDDWDYVLIDCPPS
ncbi:MAG: AAA family ATPase, partial [Spirochaetales bacterium]|nr:AAA family ATPase [Spirochaetales bacterium]